MGKNEQVTFTYRWTSMSTPILSLDWLKIYTAFNEARLSKPEFYSRSLPALLPVNAKRPPATEFYMILGVMEQLALNEQLRMPGKPADEIVRVATFDSLALESVPNLPSTYADEPEPAPVRQVRMTVPNGTVVEFESENPQDFALQLMRNSSEVR